MVWFQHVLIPVSTKENAQETCEALDPYLSEVKQITLLHVIEDSDSMIEEQSENTHREDAEEIFEYMEETLPPAIITESRIVHSEDILPAFFDEADDVDADAIAFRPRRRGLLNRLFNGDITRRLVEEPQLPVVALPDPDKHRPTSSL